MIPDLAADPAARPLPLVVDPQMRPYVSVPILHPDGSPFGTLCGLDRSPMGASDQEIAWLRILASLVGFQLERERLEKRLAQQALHDPLTLLPNRLQLMQRLTRPRRRAARREGAVAVLFLDLDNFKRVNDTLGHEAGDQLLIGVASRLRACVRDEDMVARLGGDEMVVVAEHVERIEDAITLAERILRAIAPPFDLGGGAIARTTPSIGIALSDPNREDDDLSTLLQQADHAMYRAKAAGKGRYAVFDPALDGDAAT
jgi:diguanylate cyclase (GGDEF)-like protein